MRRGSHRPFPLGALCPAHHNSGLLPHSHARAQPFLGSSSWGLSPSLKVTHLTVWDYRKSNGLRSACDCFSGDWPASATQFSSPPPPYLTTHPLGLALVQVQAHQFYLRTLSLASRSFPTSHKEPGASQPPRNREPRGPAEALGSLFPVHIASASFPFLIHGGTGPRSRAC